MTDASTQVHLLEEVQLALPFWRYYGAFKDGPYSFLLDSARDPEKLGQFSFLGGEPFLVFEAKRVPESRLADVEVKRFRTDAGEVLAAPAIDRSRGNAFEALGELLARYRVDPAVYAGSPTPFLCGAVGYFGYEAGYFIESLPDRGVDDIGAPDVCLIFVDAVLGHSNLDERTYVSALGRGADAASAREHAFARRDALLARISAFEDVAPPEWQGPSASDVAPIPVLSHFDAASYCTAVETVKEHIFAGNAYEVCLTHRLETEQTGDAWDLYQELRRINPAPFAAYLNLPGVQVVSSSPERFLRLDATGLAESRPIKGTRPRGATPQQDEKLYRELMSSIKDRAENVMIVDLVRNDFGRVSSFGSVVVTELMVIERYATVFQMVSTIHGQLEPGKDGLELVRSCFPGGSMTGAPKIEAMKIIDSLEPVKRGIYSGSIGYLDFSGALDLNIVIRTIVAKNGRFYLNVGGAITADSVPIDEYQETMDKARALLQAISNLKAICDE